MSISGVSENTYIAPSTVIQGAQARQVSGGGDPDGDGDGGGKLHKTHKGGGIGQALMQALQSLGLSAPQQGGTSSTQNSANSGKDSDGDNDGTGAAGGVKGDIRNFMHALFQAVKAEKTSTTDAAAPTDPKANFASGLAALISQVSNGSAPAELQSAFEKLAADVQPESAAVTGTAGTTATNTSTTLQKLLSQMQQNLGYGPSSSTAAIGNFVNQTA
jgi:hypothetical protein